MNDIKTNPLYIDQVYEHLLQAIAHGVLAPGSRIRQSVLSVSLGVSRQPVSHALQLLKKQGLVRDSGRQGLEVSPIDPHHVRQLYQARQSLEVLAATLAAQRAADGAATADERQALSDALETGRTLALSATDLAGLVQADASFHIAMYRFAANPVIGEMLKDQWPHLTRAMVGVLDEPGVPQRAWDEHIRITASVLAGDVATATRLMHEHLERAGNDLFARLTRKTSLAA
jgi:DNA-binding GntR family transcriptional regulator